MKKLALLLSIIMCFAVFSPVLAEGADNVTITYTIKTDEGFELWWEKNGYHEYDTTLTLTVPSGTTLTEDDVPENSKWRMYDTTWEPFDPCGYTVTEDITFTATPVSKGETKTLTFECETYGMMLYPDFYDERTISYDVACGYVLTEKDIPERAEKPGDYYNHYDITWEPFDPLGYTVTEDMTFKMTVTSTPVLNKVTYKTTDGLFIMLGSDEMNSEVTLEFGIGKHFEKYDVPAAIYVPEDDACYAIKWSPEEPLGHGFYENRDIEYQGACDKTTPLYSVNFIDGDEVLDANYVASGTSLEPPALEDNENGLFAGWDTDAYKDVRGDVDIHAIRVERGDVNADGKLDAADATLILRTLVGALEPGEYFEHIGDMNGNSHVDVGDASLILRKCAEK